MSRRRHNPPCSIRHTPDQLLRDTLGRSGLAAAAPDLGEPILRRVHARRPFVSPGRQRAIQRARSVGSFICALSILAVGVTVFDPGTWSRLGREVALSTASIGGLDALGERLGERLGLVASSRGSPLDRVSRVNQNAVEVASGQPLQVDLASQTPIVVSPFIAAAWPHREHSPAVVQPDHPTAQAAAAIAREAWMLTRAVISQTPRAANPAPPSTTMTDQVASFLSGDQPVVTTPW